MIMDFRLMIFDFRFAEGLCPYPIKKSLSAQPSDQSTFKIRNSKI